MKDKKNSTVKVHTTVQLSVPPMETPLQYLVNRVNTYMSLCGDVESCIVDESMIQLTTFCGNLRLLITNDIASQVPQSPEDLLNKNICVKGYLKEDNSGYIIEITDPEQIWLSGH